jgi:hypothetical protein
MYESLYGKMCGPVYRIEVDLFLVKRPAEIHALICTASENALSLIRLL